MLLVIDTLSTTINVKIYLFDSQLIEYHFENVRFVSILDSSRHKSFLTGHPVNNLLLNVRIMNHTYNFNTLNN